MKNKINIEFIIAALECVFGDPQGHYHLTVRTGIIFISLNFIIHSYFHFYLFSSNRIYILKENFGDPQGHYHTEFLFHCILFFISLFHISFLFIFIKLNIYILKKNLGNTQEHHHPTVRTYRI